MASAGVMNPRVWRGLPLSSAATASRCSALWTERSVLLGKYWRSRPLVFSLLPALPRRMRVAEVDRHVGGERDGPVLGQLGALVPGQRAAQLLGQGGDR